jgi:hypothetical protein
MPRNRLVKVFEKFASLFSPGGCLKKMMQLHDLGRGHNEVNEM